jgi:hypothetical protein
VLVWLCWSVAMLAGTRIRIFSRCPTAG